MVTQTLEPTEFFSDVVWWRGVIDLLILDKDQKVATIIDYKTGKNSRYADMRQLSLMSVAIFKHFPGIEKIKSALLFLVSKEVLRSDYKIEKVDDMYKEWGSLVKRINQAYESDVFNASPNFACRSFCPVEQCAHWGK